VQLADSLPISDWRSELITTAGA